MEARVQPVILAGGAGTRLAPISTESCPKPFVILPDGTSLLSQTCARLKHSMFLPPLLIGARAQRFALLNHARSAAVAPAAILLEPEAKNTALAAAVAAAWALRHQPDTLLALLPADHHIAPVEAWWQALGEAASAAAVSGELCLLAVPPSFAAPRFGYMQLASAGDTWHRVQHFVEKPSVPESLGPDWYWNSGQFVAPAARLAELFAQHAPSCWALAQQALAAAQQEWEFTLLPEAAYRGAATASFDRAIVENTPCVAVMLGARWQDLGTLAAWEEATGISATAYPPQTRVDRPWGYFEWLHQSPERVEKKIILFPGCRLSRQMHRQREEFWEVLEGIAEIEKDDSFHRLGAGSTMRIPSGSWHRLGNGSDHRLVIKEIQSGSPDETDIERAADDYGRA